MLLGWAALASPAAAQSSDSTMWETLRQADLKLATIGYRLSVANAPLCDRTEPGTGLLLHTLAQYDHAGRDAVRAHFKLRGTLGVAGVVQGSPAEKAGVKQDDTILSIGGIPAPPEPPDQASTAALVQLHSALAALPADRPMKVVVRRDGATRELAIQPVLACFTRYELRIADQFDARADGELVQISSKFLEAIPEELLPATVAHELAHNILQHRKRLSDAGAAFGFASGFGRNVGYFRQAELEADILSVHLLARAGYPHRIAGRFWREVGDMVLGARIRSRSHPANRDRAATLEAESARIDRAGAQAPPPDFYVNRAKPMTGEWRHLLVRER